jgi:hypothetical protein
MDGSDKVPGSQEHRAGIQGLGVQNTNGQVMVILNAAEEMHRKKRVGN